MVPVLVLIMLSQYLVRLWIGYFNTQEGYIMLTNKETIKEFAEALIDKRINTTKYGEVILLSDLYNLLDKYMGTDYE